MSLWTESNPEIDKLKRINQALDLQVGNFGQQCASLKAQLAELTSTHKEALGKLSEKEAALLVAQDLARKKTDELKIAQVQKANAQQAIVQLEKNLATEKDEVKRLNYELERATSAKPAPANASAVRAAEDKAKLEKQVQTLTTKLAMAEHALEKEKENAGPKVAAAPLKRTSMSPADVSNSQQRNRFGFGGAAPPSAVKPCTSILPDPTATPARPASSLGHHSTGIPGPSSSAIPKRRRSSSFAGVPASAAVSTASTAPRIAQLEREVEDSRSRAETVEKDFLAVKTKLSAKERELLTLENRLLASDRAKSEELAALKSRLEDAYDDFKHSKTQAEETRATIRAEMDRVVKDSREEKQNLLAKIQRMQAELDKRESEIERHEMRCQELQEELERAKDEDKAARAKSGKLLEETQSRRSELERQVAQLQADLEAEFAKESQRNQLEVELESTKQELADVKTRTTKALDDLRGHEAELERELQAAKQDANNSTALADLEADLERLRMQTTADMDLLRQDKELAERELAAAHEQLASAGSDRDSSPTTAAETADSAELERLRDELNTAQHELAAALDQAAELATRDVVPAADLAVAQAQADEARGKVQEHVATIDALEQNRSELEARLQNVTAQQEQSALKQKETIEEIEGLETLLAETRAELDALRQSESDSDRNESAESAARISELEKILSEKEQALSELTSQLDSISSKHAAQLAAVEASKLEFSAALATVIQERDITSIALTEAEERLSSLDAALEDLASARGANETLEKEKAIAAQLATDRQVELDSLRHSFAGAQEALKVSSSRSFDDAHVNELQADLDTARELVDDLTQQVEQLEKVEWGANEARAVAETRTKELEHRVEELEAGVESAEVALKTTQAAIEQDIAAGQSALEEAESRAASISAALQTQTSLLEQRNTHIAELEKRILEHEVDLRAMDDIRNELESLKTWTEESKFVALEDVNDLQRRLAAQQIEIDRLSSQVAELESLRAALEVAEDRAVELARDLERVKSDHAALSAESDARQESASARLHDADAEISRLRAELDSTLEGLRSARERAAAATSELEAGDDRDIAPDSASLFSTFTEAHVSTLVSRLREERDALRTRLDFAQREADFRREALETRYEEAEERKMREISRLNDEILRKTAELATDNDALASARDTILQLEQRLREAGQQVRDLRQASQREAMSPASPIRSLGADVNSAAVLRLQSQVDELQARVLRRTETIGRHEQTIAQLQIRLAAMDEDDDAEADDTMEIPASTRNLPSDVTERSAELQQRLEAEQKDRVSVENQLRHTVAELGNLQHQLVAQITHTNELESELGAALEAEAELADLLDEAKAMHDDAETRSSSLLDQLSALKAVHADLGQAHEEANGEINELALQLEMQEADHDDSLERIEALTAELADVKEQYSDAVSELELTKSSVEALRPSLAAMERRLEDAAAAEDALRQALAEKESAMLELRQQAVATEIDGTREAELEVELVAITARLTEALRELSNAGAEATQLRSALSTATTQHEDEIERLREELDRLSRDAEQLVRLREEVDFAQSEVASLNTRLMETIQNLEASKVAIADRDMAASQLEERVVIESTARTQAEEHISRIQALLDSATQDVEAERQRLQGAQAAVEESEERLRTQGEEYRRLHGQLAQEKEELAAQLSQARNQLEEQEHTAQQETGLIRQFESQLDAARREIDNLNSIVESERTALDVAKAAAEEDKSERQAVEKVKAALEAATRENKTLRSLARGAETDVDALKNENARLGQMTSALEHEARALETRYRELERTSQANISELLDTLQLAEEAKADAERRAAETEAQLRDAQAQASSSLSQEAVFDLTEHVKLLEKQLDARAAENEETDEKYMEVLKQQKRYVSSIERLKAKIASLQRDLAVAKASVVTITTGQTPAETTGPINATAPAAPVSGGKKRRAPTEFDPSSATTTSARAVVATLARSPSMKENLSSRPLSTRIDEVVPLKPAALSPQPAREALKSVGTNGGAASTSAKDAASASKVQELRARLAAQRQRSAA